MTGQQQQKQEPKPYDGRGDKQKNGYGTPKPDMGGYIGEREGAGDEENPESLPGGGG